MLQIEQIRPVLCSFHLLLAGALTDGAFAKGDMCAGATVAVAVDVELLGLLKVLELELELELVVVVVALEELRELSPVGEAEAAAVTLVACGGCAGVRVCVERLTIALLTTELDALALVLLVLAVLPAAIVT